MLACLEAFLIMALVHCIYVFYWSSHVELVLFFGYKACGVPEATLPQPFSQKSQASLGKMPAEFPEVVGSSGGNCWMFDLEQFPLESIESLPYSADNELLLTSSHLHPAFSPRFSQKTVAVAAEKTILLTCPASVSSAVSGAMNNQAVKTWQAEESPASLVNNKCVKSKQLMELPDTCSKSGVVNPPVPPISSQRVRYHDCESPVQKLASPADSLMLETPAQVIPKRSIPSCDNKLRDMTIRGCRSCHMPAKRFIDFSHLDDERNSFGMQTDSDSVLNDEISQDVGVGANEEGNDNVSLPLLDKVGPHFKPFYVCGVLLKLWDIYTFVR